MTDTLRRHQNENGSAMMTAIIVAMLIALFSMIVVNLVVVNHLNSARAARTEGLRIVSEAALDEVYATLTKQPSYLTDSTGLATHPGYDPPGTGIGFWKWAKITNGTVQPCTTLFTDPAEVCYHLSAVSTGRDATIEITTATNCIGNEPDGSPDWSPNCQMTRYQQRLQRVSYFDYLYLTDLEVLDPALSAEVGGDGFDFSACDTRKFGADNIPGNSDDRDPLCLEPAYFADRDFGSESGTFTKDVIAAPIHTNDHVIQLCGKIVFDGAVEVSGGDLGNGDPSGQPYVPAAACNASPTFNGGYSVTAPRLALPTTEDIRSRLQPIAESNGHYYTGDTRIELLSAGGMRITNANVNGGSPTSFPTYPDGGVIFVDGTARVDGVVNGKLTIAAAGNIRIVGDLTYGDMSADLYNPALLDDDTLGLITGEYVIVEWPYDGHPDADEVRHVMGAIVARTFYNDQWHDGFHGGNPPTLHFFGTIATKYRGAFGGYDKDTANLVSGYAKDFHFDDNMTFRQPPYLVDALVAAWQRSDIREVPPGVTAIS